MKRLSLLLLAAAFLVGCGPSRMPTDFGGSSAAGGTGATDLNLLGSGATGAAAQAARDGVIPPEAILVTVQFDFDQYTVSAAERAKLDGAAGKAKATKLLIVGYTDQFGTEEYNLGLSDKRAQSVRDYLVKLGCNPADSEVLGLGEQQADKSAAGRQSAAKDRKAVVVDANYFTRGGAPAAPAAGKTTPTPAKAPSSGPAPGPVTAL
jgi:peptidoglycan-associated lipoprotein